MKGTTISDLERLFGNDEQLKQDVGFDLGRASVVCSPGILESYRSYPLPR